MKPWSLLNLVTQYRLYLTEPLAVRVRDPIETHNGDLLCPEAKLRSSASGKLDLMITDGELIQILTEKLFPHLAFSSLP